MRAFNRLSALTLLAGAAAALTSCSSSSGSSGPKSTSPPPSTTATATTATSPTTASSQQVEINPPGDIPDNQAFVPSAGKGFVVTVPEGWARTARANEVIFSDKYNSITITSASSAAAPTPASAASREVPTIKAAAQAFTPGSISQVHRTAGTALLINYRALSPVNPVTGKVANEAVERYEFWRAGREVVLTLAAPVGSDNVDPWRAVTNSFRWTGR